MPSWSNSWAVCDIEPSTSSMVTWAPSSVLSPCRTHCHIWREGKERRGEITKLILVSRDLRFDKEAVYAHHTYLWSRDFCSCWIFCCISIDKGPSLCMVCMLKQIVFPPPAPQVMQTTVEQVTVERSRERHHRPLTYPSQPRFDESYSNRDIETDSFRRDATWRDLQQIIW